MIEHKMDRVLFSLPHIRFCLEQACNLRCWKCLKPTGGEGHASQRAPLSSAEAIEFLHQASMLGFRYIKFTGGEPFLRNHEHIAHILLSLANQNLFSGIELVTNGTILFSDLPLLKKTISVLTVSLDTLDRNKYCEFTGFDYLPLVLENLYTYSKAGIPLKLNCIVTQSTCKELPTIAEFAKTLRAELKILDLLLFRIPDDKKEEYYATGQSSNLLQLQHREQTILRPPGNFGVPMRVWFSNGQKIIVKDSSDGTAYNSICEQCSFFPCQDGLYGLRIAHDGVAKMCWPRRDLTIHHTEKDLVSEQLRATLKWYVSASFRQSWKPHSACKRKPYRL